MNILLLMMGGQGTRFGTNIPKQFTIINNQPIFSYIVKKYDEHPDIDKIIMVSHKEWISYVLEETTKLKLRCSYEIVEGGNTRSQSILNGLSYAYKNHSKSDIILIHDATHPYVDITGTSNVIDAVNKGGGATLGAHQYDTVYQTDRNGFLQQVLPRQYVISGASPEGFRLGDIYPIYKSASLDELEKMTSAGAIALAHNIPMKVIPTHILNLKITYPEDMILFQQLAEQYFFIEQDK